jgi:hypothetical protein
VPHRAAPYLQIGAAALAAALLLVPASPGAAGPPAALAESGDNAAATFDRFAERWMQEKRDTAAQRRRATALGQLLTYRDPGEVFELELRATGHPRAPWVGILRYDEREVACSDHTADHCGVKTTPVTEIFRYQNGRWVY